MFDGLKRYLGNFIGEFIGDNDLLVLAPSEQGFRRVMVAMAIDNRADWWLVGTAIADFLARYLEHQGEKYWEP